MTSNENATMVRLARELREETADLQESLRNLAAEDFDLATPAHGWDIGDSLAHLALFDAVASVAIEDPETFAAVANRAEKDLHYFDAEMRKLRSLTPQKLYGTFASNREAFINVALAHSGERILWFGPPMRTETMVTARQMETFAHGVDIRDTLGEPIFFRRRHLNVVYLGYRTIEFAFLIHGLEKPPGDVEIVVVLADGEEVTFGKATLDDLGEKNRVRGPLGDLALLVVQRRNYADLDLEVTGLLAGAWVKIAQAYAGLPGEGRPSSKTM